MTTTATAARSIGWFGSMTVPTTLSGVLCAQVGDIPASGLIFKDSINIEAFRDPKVDGVTIYIR